MVLYRALLHLSPRSKTHENIRKRLPGVGPQVLLSRTKEGAGKYRGNNAIAGKIVMGRTSLASVPPKRFGEGPTTTDQQQYLPLQVLHERIGNVSPMIVGDARGRALHVFHQAIE